MNLSQLVLTGIVGICQMYDMISAFRDKIKGWCFWNANYLGCVRLIFNVPEKRVRTYTLSLKITPTRILISYQNTKENSIIVSRQNATDVSSKPKKNLEVILFIIITPDERQLNAPFVSKIRMSSSYCYSNTRS